MSAVTSEKPRNEKSDATINLVAQIVLFVPALMLFGFTTVNIVTAIIFLIVAAIRFFHPTERVRKIEFTSNLVLGVLWLLYMVIF